MLVQDALPPFFGIRFKVHSTARRQSDQSGMTRSFAVLWQAFLILFDLLSSQSKASRKPIGILRV